MGIYRTWKRKDNGLHEGKITINGKQISKYGKSRAEVVRKLDQLKKEAEKGNIIGKNIRLDRSLRQYLENIKKPELKPSSYDRLICTHKNQIENTNLGRMQVAAIKPSDISNLLMQCARSLSKSSTKKVYDLLGAYYKYMVASRELSFNPMLLVKMPNEAQFSKKTKEMEVLTVDEMKKVIEVAELKKADGSPYYRYGEAVILSLMIGTRSGETRAIKLSNVDLEERILHIRDNIAYFKDETSNKYVYEYGTLKTAQSKRDIPLNDRAILAINRLKETTYSTENDLLITTDSGKMLSNQYFEKTYDSILKRAGIRHMGLHSTRHTFATATLKEAKVKGQIKEVSELLGHSEVSTTYKHYIKTNNEDKRDLIQSLNGLINPAYN